MPMLLALIVLLSLTSGAFAQTPRSGQLEELKQLSIEELADTDVTTASRRIERRATMIERVRHHRR